MDRAGAAEPQRKKSRRQRRRRDGKRILLHPARMLELLRRAGWLARLAALFLLLLALLGVVLVVAPFGVRMANPEPPPWEITAPCPPPPVASFAGRGGLTGPLDGFTGDPDIPGFAEYPAARIHDVRCLADGRRRLVTGLLLLGAGYVNAAAILEVARNIRRARRRRRREERRRLHAERERLRESARARATSQPS